MERGIVIIHDELHESWIDWLRGTEIDTFAIHAAGGVRSAETLAELIEYAQTEHGKRYINTFRECGMKIEYEYHAMSWLLPRSEFSRHPEYFRLDENGQRNADVNLCPSSSEALEIISSRAAELARLLPPDTDKFYIWQDDVFGKKCHCRNCKNYNISDQVLLMMNAVLGGLRRVNPCAKTAYLAYFDTANELPSCVKPDKGIFLEFAPFKRVFDIPINGDSEANQSEIKMLPALLDFFGKADAAILEYWIDNSLQSGFKRPPKKLIFQKDVCVSDIKFYNSLGFEKITCFAGYLDDEYVAIHGTPPVYDYATCLTK